VRKLLSFGALSLLVGCSAERQALPEEGESSGQARGEGEGEGAPDNEGPPGPGGNSETGDAGTAAESMDAGFVGCPVGMRSDHNGCLPLPSGEIVGACAPEARAPGVLLGGLAIEELDQVAPERGVVGRRTARWRNLQLTGVISTLRPGRVVVEEVDGEVRTLSMDLGMDPGQVLPLNLGDVVEVEYTWFSQDVLDQNGTDVLRTHASSLLRISDGEGRLVYALGDPFVPPRNAEENLERLGIFVGPADAPICGYTEMIPMSSPVGMCHIYRRNAPYSLGEAGERAVVLPGASAEFQEAGRRYRVDNGDSFFVEDSHDDCNVVPQTELRIVWLG